ncbi:NDR1/HIN1-like protein 13 [Silene latifolia]|uniref:NDR1/HIN1-like protein 13 n=1 Tax=Silene latifolia TaxID=37657 RepID=UPI003D788A03
MSEYDGDNNPHFRPRHRPDPTTIPNHIQPEPMQPWDYHPTQIPPPDRIQPRGRPHSQPPGHDHQEPLPPMVHLRPPEHAPMHHQPSRHSRPLDQPGQQSHLVDGPPERHPKRHSLPVVGAPYPQDYQPRPKPTRPSHGNSEHANLMYPEQSRTNPITWCGAVFCVILWMVIILGGLLVLIIYLVYRPRTPHFEISNASLNAVYLDMGYLLNADLTVLVNFTNPNKKVHVDFSYVTLQLYFERHLIANQYIEPFSASSGENKLANVEMVSSQVRLPIAVRQKLITQIQRNRIMFEVDGIFHARSNFGSLLKYSYWLYGHCIIEMTGPPSGITISTKCYTKD